MAVQPRNPIGDSQLVRLKYCQIESANPGAGTAADHIWRATGIFDPYYTGVGHQPMGSDEWAFFYNHYHVIGAKIKVLFSSTATGNTSNYIGTIHTSADTTAVTDLETLLERTGTQWGNVAPVDAGKPLTLVKKFSTKRFFNCKDVLDNDNLRGTIAVSDPSENAYFHVGVFNPDGTTDNVNCNLTVEIEYICILTERKSLVKS